MQYYGFLPENVIVSLDELPSTDSSFPKAQVLKPSFFTVDEDLITKQSTTKMVEQSRTICTTLSRMVAQSNAGDTILFYFIGHGDRSVSSYANNIRHDECLLCGDGSRIYGINIYFLLILCLVTLFFFTLSF